MMLSPIELAKQVYDAGRSDSLEAFEANFEINDSWRKPSSEEYKTYQPLWSEYLTEYSRLENLYYRPLVNPVFDKLDQWTKENNVTYSFGCGCCGGINITLPTGEVWSGTERIEDEE